METQHKFVWAIGLVVVAVAVVLLVQSGTNTAASSFSECVAAGNPVMESYPRQCQNKNGEVFVEDITDDGNTKKATTTTATYRGEITTINSEQIAYDGPYIITIQSDAGIERTITVPSMGRRLCRSQEVADIASLSVGDIVEVKGEQQKDGEVGVCGSADDYLRLAN